MEVKKVIALDDRDIFIYKIRNIMADKALADRNESIEARLKIAAPVLTTCETYFTSGARMGGWGDWKERR